MAKTESSKRQMNAYAPTKSDPICKWRAVSIANAIEIVSWLPKRAMSSDEFRDYMRKSVDGDFFHTAYQLACQMGLYCEDDGVYTPRFDHNITEEEALEYLTLWMERYYVPNPYTKQGFIGVPPTNLVNALQEYMDNFSHEPNLATAGRAIFGGEMGNISSVKSMLNSFANDLEVDKDYNIVILTPHEGPVEVGNDRNDKRAFFEYFNK